MRDHLNQTISRDLMRVDAAVPGLSLGEPATVGSLIHLCAAVFSWMLGGRVGNRATHVYRLRAGLLLYAAEAGLQVNAGPCTGAPIILRRRGLTWHDVQSGWRAQRAQAGYEAFLPPDLLIEMFPPPVWHSLATLVGDGPDLCSQRIDKLLHRVALRPAAAHAGGEKGASVSSDALSNYAWPLSWTTKTLVDFRSHGFPCPKLELWTHRSAIQVPPAPRANTDRSSPHWRHVRLLVDGLDRKIKNRLGASTDDEEIEILCSRSGRQTSQLHVWRKMRLRALIAVVCCLGGRSGAVCDLRRADVVAEHAGPDGRCGPAIALRPGKTYDPREIHYKPIPVGLYLWIKAFIVATDGILAETRYCGGHERLAQRSLPNDLALFSRSLREPWRSLSQRGFYHQLVGHKAKPKYGIKAKKPLLPRADGRWYSPHTLRGCAMQMVKHAALDYLPLHHPDLTADDLAEALVDHDLPGDRYGYFDKNTLRGREIISGIAIELAWAMLTTETGARKVRDADAYRTVIEAKQILRAELDRIRASISEVLNDPSRRKNLQIEALVRAQALNEEREQLRERLNALEARAERLRTDPATRIPAPDDLLDEELEDRFDEIDRELAGASRPAALACEAPEPVRDPPWITVPEATILGASYQEVARWANGEHLPYGTHDPRNPWQADCVPVDTSRGPRRRRISVRHINPTYLRAAAQRRQLAAILTHWPDGWSEADCRAPLILAAGLRDQRSSR